MVRKSKKEQEEFEKTVIPARISEVKEQGVIPEEWDLISNVINWAEANGNTKLVAVCERLMEESFIQDKTGYMREQLLNIFKSKVKSRGSSNAWNEDDYTNETLLRLLIEDTKGNDVSGLDFADELKEKLRMKAATVFKDAYKASSNKEVPTDITPEIFEAIESLPETFTSGKEFRKATADYNKRVMEQKQANQQRVEQSGPVRILTEEEKSAYRPVTVDEKKADTFQKAVAKRDAVKNKKRRKEG